MYCDSGLVLERGQIILSTEWRISLWIFLPESSFDLVIMCVLCFQPWQMEFCTFLLKAGFGLFLCIWNMADLWPYLIYTLYCFFINKVEEIHLSPFHEITVTHGAYIARVIRYIFFPLLFSFPSQTATCLQGKQKQHTWLAFVEKVFFPS